MLTFFLFFLSLLYHILPKDGAAIHLSTIFFYIFLTNIEKNTYHNTHFYYIFTCFPLLFFWFQWFLTNGCIGWILLVFMMLEILYYTILYIYLYLSLSLSCFVSSIINTDHLTSWIIHPVIIHKFNGWKSNVNYNKVGKQSVDQVETIFPVTILCKHLIWKQNVQI